MTRKEIMEHGIHFINKMNYTIRYDKINIVDHVNKIVHIEYPDDIYTIYSAVLAVLFRCVPKFVHNFFKKAFKEEFYMDLTNWNFGKYMIDRLENTDYLVFSNKDDDIYTLFHPWINRNLVNKLDEATEILFSKMFDDEDNYFGIVELGKPIDIKELDLNKKVIDYACISLTGGVTGSIGLACYGTVYRNNFHDLDFIVPAEYLGKEINNLLDDELNHNKIVGKHRVEVEKKVKKLFKDLLIYEDLVYKFDNVSVKSCSVDRVTAYDQSVKCTFVIMIDGKEYDFIFKNSYNTRYNDDIESSVQELADILQSKILLGRPKDYRDIINFKPFKTNIKYRNKDHVSLL